MTIRTCNIIFGYDPRRIVLHGVTIDIQPGKVTGIFGPNGSGKSTLLSCLNGVLKPQSGSVLIDDCSIECLTHRDIAKKIAVVPQDLPPPISFTVREMVMMGRFSRWDTWQKETVDDHRIVSESLARMKLETLTNVPFNKISGGERQRVILARVLAQDTPILLLDEPSNHLDITHQLETYRLARSLAQEGRTVLMICHDLLLVPMFTDHAVLLKEGVVHSEGKPKDVLNTKNIEQVFGTYLELNWMSNISLTAHIDSACLRSSTEEGHS